MNSIEEKIKIHNLFHQNENKHFYGDPLVFNAYFYLTIEELEFVYKKIISENNDDVFNKENYLFKILYSLFLEDFKTPIINCIKNETKKNIIKNKILNFIRENEDLDICLHMETFKHPYGKEGLPSIKGINIFEKLNESFETESPYDSNISLNLFHSLLTSRNPNDINHFLNFLDQEDVNDAINFTNYFTKKTKKTKNNKKIVLFNELNNFIHFINFDHIKIKRAKTKLIETLNNYDDKIELENTYFVVNHLETIIFFIQEDKVLLDTFLSFVKKNIVIKNDAKTHVHSPDFSSLVILSSIIKEITTGEVHITTGISTDLFDYVKEKPPLEDLSLEELKIMNENKDEDLYLKFKKVNIQDYEL